jgi:hypothetical protein
MVFLSPSDFLLRNPSAKPRGGFFAFCHSPAPWRVTGREPGVHDRRGDHGCTRKSAPDDAGLIAIDHAAAETNPNQDNPS